MFDHFHIIKLMNEKLSDLRRQLYRQLTEDLPKDVLKGTRWLLLKNPENLDKDRDERARLDEALRLNAPLATAYYLKEDLRQRQAYGFRDQEFFILKIYALHESKYALVG